MANDLTREELKVALDALKSHIGEYETDLEHGQDMPRERALVRKIEEMIGYGGEDDEIDQLVAKINSDERPMADYRLPDGTIVRVDDTAAKGALVIDFTLAGGRIVQAVRVRVDV